MSFGSQAWVATRGQRLEAHLTTGRFLFLLAVTAALWLLAACFVLGVATSVGGSPWVWLSLLIVAPLAATLTGQLVLLHPGRPALVLDDEGVRHPVFGGVRWHEVCGIALDWQAERGSRVPVLALGLDAGAEVSGGWRWLRRLKPRDRLFLPLQGLDHAPATIHELALKLRDRLSPPRIAVWFSLMGQEVVAALRTNEQLLARMETLAAQTGPVGTDVAREAIRLVEELQVHDVVLGEAFEADRRRLLREGRVLGWWIGALTVVAVLAQLARLLR